MLMDQISGMLEKLGDQDEEVILAGITAARFRDPIFFGEEVEISLTKGEESMNTTSIDYEARVKERDSLVSNGVINIVIT